MATVPLAPLAECSCVGRTRPSAPFGGAGGTSEHRCNKGVALPAGLPSSRWASVWEPYTCPQGPWGPQLGCSRWSRDFVVASHRLGAPAAELPPPWTRPPPRRNPDASRFLVPAPAPAPALASGTSAAVPDGSRDPSASLGTAASPLVSAAPAPARCTPDRSTRFHSRRPGTPPPAEHSSDSKTAVRHALPLFASLR